MFFNRSNPTFFLIFILSLFLCSSSSLATIKTFSTHFSSLDIPGDGGGLIKRELEEENSTFNSTLILAAKRTQRRDPLNNFKRYTGGYNISNKHYWASVALTATPFFVVAGVWFVLFGLTLAFICLCYCCCRREPYGYSRMCYALSLILLIFFTIAAIVGCIVLFTGQQKFHSITTHTLDYVVNQANSTAETLRDVSDYLAAARDVSIESIVLPTNIKEHIDKIETQINSSSTILSSRTNKNSKDIQNVLDYTRLALIILAAVMLALAFLGLLLSIFGLQCIVYFMVIFGWILVAATFILCGVFLLIHNVVADSCVAMDEWVLNPTAKTALDDIIPCVDNATAQATLQQSKEVTYQLVNVVDNIINNVTNRNFPPQVGPPLYFNQSGPLMPVLCNPFNSDFTDRQCAADEVSLKNATEVWKSYTCEVSSSGICTTAGRLTPTIYSQMSSAVNFSYGLSHYGPFLVSLVDCTFVRQTFTEINNSYCPDLRKFTQWIYIGLVMVSAAVMLSLIFWVIYARERRHRVYTKQFMSNAMENQNKTAP